MILFQCKIGISNDSDDHLTDDNGIDMTIHTTIYNYIYKALLNLLSENTDDSSKPNYDVKELLKIVVVKHMATHKECNLPLKEETMF